MLSPADIAACLHCYRPSETIQQAHTSAKSHHGPIPCMSSVEGIFLSSETFVSDTHHLSTRYTKEQILAVRTAHRKAYTWQDRAALGTVRLLRWGMDFVSGYNSRPANTNTLSKAYVMTEEKWITRFVFLESVAGVPGMVAGMLRHLKSIRRMRRDNGW